MNTITTLRLRATALLRRCLWPIVRRWTIVDVTRGGTYYRLRTDGKIWELQAIGGMGDRKWHPIDRFPWTPIWRGESAVFWEAIEQARARGQTPLPPNKDVRPSR